MESHNTKKSTNPPLWEFFFKLLLKPFLEFLNYQCFLKKYITLSFTMIPHLCTLFQRKQLTHRGTPSVRQGHLIFRSRLDVHSMSF